MAHTDSASNDRHTGIFGDELNQGRTAAGNNKVYYAAHLKHLKHQCSISVINELDSTFRHSGTIDSILY